MTFWLDAHLHPDLAPWLGAGFSIVVKTLREIGLRDADDVQLFEAARRFDKIVIVTKDEDFAELIGRRGSPPQIVWLTCGNLTAIETQIWLRPRFADVLRRLEAGEALVRVV